MPIYEEIAANLSTDEGQCVLVLGPELSVNKQGLYYKSRFKELAAKNKSYISEYFERENIFSFIDRSGLDAMFGDISAFYNNVGDDTLLELIGRIKFPLIINVCPDKAINKLFRSNHIPYVYGYFCKGSQQNDEATKYSFEPNIHNPGARLVKEESLLSVPKPTRDWPVVYNIFGDCEVGESMIFDHETFYTAMEALMAVNAIPGKILNFINKANCIIFLGFDFDSWHYQLMLHKMGLGKNKSKKSYGSHMGDNGRQRVRVVIRDYFKINFVQENPVNTVQQIIKALKENQQYAVALREPTPNEHYSIYISYAWKDKQAEILELLFKVIKASEITKEEKSEQLWELITKSGKLLLPEENIDWVFNSSENANGQTLEEWYHNLPAVNGMPKKLLYNREHVVDMLEEKLTENGIKVFRDKNEMTYGDSIDSFMNRIGTGKAVIRVVSDKYLKSRYCMDEALRIHRHSKTEKRIFTIVLRDDVDLAVDEGAEAINLNDGDDVRYKKYWQNMVEDLYGKLDSAISGLIDKERTKKNYGIYIDIYDYVMDFIKEIKDELHMEMAGETNLAGISIEQTKPLEEQMNRINSFIEVIKLKLQI